MNGAPPTLASNGNLVDLYLRANGTDKIIPGRPGRPARRKKAPAKKPAKMRRSTAKPAPLPLPRSPVRLEQARRALSLCRCARRVLETHGELTTDLFDLYLAAMERWVRDEDTDESLDAAGRGLYQMREEFAPAKGMGDEEYLSAQCRNALVWALWGVSSYLRNRHDGQIVTRCRMMLAQTLARWDEDPFAARTRAHEVANG